ncbi:SH3 domain-containing protein [Oscillatoria sp. CS-180]|uniref:SH3 domain-containing protein n=1 Tax=Oscillatoria sp. CS-180 TaxID=3021720 RepID=UPI00233100FB|nr:SH3 domain-containing protein [Oscillatoria sp. CS-180]MDB9525635.1 SH3 domain-containing protein [Oscillatoria sp. CS-180]
MKGIFLGFTKLVLGITLALLLLSLTGIATARYFMAKLSVLPPKPMFENDAALEQPTSTETAAVPSPQPEPTPNPEPAPERPPGSYDAVVVQPIGLVLRSGPGVEHQQLGGVDYNDEVLVMETSEDERWMRVRVNETGQEGWVKSGNTQNLNEPVQ